MGCVHGRMRGRQATWGAHKHQEGWATWGVLRARLHHTGCAVMSPRLGKVVHGPMWPGPWLPTWPDPRQLGRITQENDQLLAERMNTVDQLPEHIVKELEVSKATVTPWWWCIKTLIKVGLAASSWLWGGHSMIDIIIL